MILDDILSVKDIFYIFTDYISYESFISLSMLNKNFYQNIKKYCEIESIRKRIKHKFHQRISHSISVSQLKENQMLESYLLQHMKDNLTILDKEMFRNLYIYNNLYSGDIILFHNKYFLIDIDRIYPDPYKNELYVPKSIQRKLGLSRWPDTIFINAFVKIHIDDFDFDSIEYIIYNSWNNYVKIWNHNHKIDMIFYIWNLDLDMISRQELIDISKNRIKDIIQYPRLYRNFDSIYYENGDIRIFKWNKENISGWFLE